MASHTTNTVFLIAMEYEMNNIFADYTDKLIRIETNAPYAVYSIADTPHLILLTGIGKSNAAAATQYTITQFTPQRVINLGLIGCLKSKNHSVGEICLVAKTYFADVDVTAFNYAFGQIPETSSNEYVLATDLSVFPNLQPELHKGIKTIKHITIDAFVTDNALIKRATDEFDPTGLDMELTSIAHIAWRNAYLEKLYSFKAIVDFVNEKSKQDFYEKEALAFKNIRQLVPELL